MKLVIVDASVVLYQIAGIIDSRYGEKVTESGEAAVYAEAAIQFVNKLGWLPALQNQPCKVVWVEDAKPYWRYKLYPQYKSHRKAKPLGFSVAAQVFKKAPVARLKFAGYEADDIAAAIVRLWLKSTNQIVNQIFLATVDSDWCGLVLHPEIYWLNTRGFEPRLRSRTQIYNWLCGKWAKQSKKKQAMWQLPSFPGFSCSDIWNWKIATGDAADNLGIDSAPHFINLIRPPRIYDLCDQPNSVSAIHQCINRAEVINKAGVRDAQNAIFALGLTLPIDTLLIPANIANKSGYSCLDTDSQN